MFYTRSGAIKLSLAAVLGLVALKIAAAAITGSISILAQAADSFLDIFAVILTFFLINISSKPADREHPFGHGKVENIAATIQALLLFLAAALIIYSSVTRIIEGEEIQLTEAGIAVMAVSIVVSVLLSRHLLRVSQREDSMALEGNARNIASDVYSAAATLAGLLVVRLTGIVILDPVIAILVSLYILKTGVSLLRKSSRVLIDVKLPEEEEALIKSTIMEHGQHVIGFHKLRTRHSGNQHYIDLHLVMPKNESVEKAHQLADHIEQDIRSRLPNTSVIIHIEPCNGECKDCNVICDVKNTQG